MAPAIEIEGHRVALAGGPIPDRDKSGRLSLRLGRNSRSGIFRVAVLTAVYFVTYPYMLHRLGTERFGMWALALVISQSLGTQDLGIAGALMRFIPEHWNNGGKNRIQELASTAILLLAGIGFTLGIAVFLLRQWIVSLLNIPSPLQSEMSWLLVVMAVVFFLSLISSGLTAILVGIHRMDVSNVIYTSAALIQGVGVFFALSRGYGLLGLAANAALMTFLWGSATWIFLHYFMPGFRLRFSMVHRADSVSLLRYGLNIQAAGIGSFLTIPPIKVLLSRYVSLASVSSFELASGMALQLRSGFLMAAMPLIPASAHLDSEKASAHLGQLYRRSLRYIVLVGLPVFSLVAVLAPGFVEFWLRRETPYVASTLALLLLGWFFNTLTLPAYFMLQGQGLARYQMYSTALQATCSVVFGYILVQILGYYGAVIGLVAGLSAAAAYLLWVYPRLCQGSRGTLFDGSLLKAAVINGILLTPFILRPEWRQTHRFFWLFFLAASYLVIYLALLIAFAGLTESERKNIASAWPPNIFRRLMKGTAIPKASQTEQNGGVPLI